MKKYKVVQPKLYKRYVIDPLTGVCTHINDAVPRRYIGDHPKNHDAYMAWLARDLARMEAL